MSGNAGQNGPTPVTFLQNIVQTAPSRQALAALAGDIIDHVKQSDEVAIPYIYAVARHLPTAAVGISAGTVPAEDSLQVASIIAALGVALSRCNPRTAIAQSGILLVLEKSLPASATMLQPIHVEFLQACIFAEQYSLAETRVANTWPRPSNGISVSQVLRYYYLRGCVHMATSNLAWAVRCLWTCLSIPGDVVSAIQIAAWKKLLLAQCLRLSKKGYFPTSSIDPLAIPKAAPPCLSRMVNLALCMKQPAKKGVPTEDPEVVHMVEQSAGGIEAHREGLSSHGIETDKTKVAMIMSLYGRIAEAFVQIQPVQFDELINKHQASFVDDGNFGFVLQCRAALLRRQTYQLSSIYSDIPLQRLSQLLSLGEDKTRNLILQLVVDHGWQVGIKETDKGCIISFPPFPHIASETTESELMELGLFVRNLDVSIATSSKYVASVRKDNNKSARTSSPARGPRGVEDL